METKDLKTLFLCKKRSILKYGSFGLINSAKFVVNYLNSLCQSEIAQCVDGNDIDREVVKYNADIVFIEALWVTPEKIDELLSMKSHKNRKWIIRIHSKFSFLANEGIAFEWFSRYADLMKKYNNLYVAPNSEETANNLRKHYKMKNFIYLPNLYDSKEIVKNYTIKKSNSSIDVGCFGAIRPMKNQLIQAIAAIDFAKSIGKHLNFHINKHTEQSGDQVYKNIKALFDSCKESATLVEHEWLSHEEFLCLVSQMDIGMQVSYNETYNIVAADFVSMGIPIVVSNEIKLVNYIARTSPNSVFLIKCSLKLNYYLSKIKFNRIDKFILHLNVNGAKSVWKKLVSCK